MLFVIQISVHKIYVFIYYYIMPIMLFAIIIEGLHFNMFIHIIQFYSFVNEKRLFKSSIAHRLNSQIHVYILFVWKIYIY